MNFYHFYVFLDLLCDFSSIFREFACAIFLKVKFERRKKSTFRMSGSALFELGSGDLAAWQIRWCCKVETKPVQFNVRFLTKKGFITTVLSGPRH